MPHLLHDPDICYGLLTGTPGVLGEHKRLVARLTRAWKALPGVEGILGLGSLAHSFADTASDVDVLILGTALPQPPLWQGEHWLAGVCVDMMLVDIDAQPPFTWDSARKQACEEAVVLWLASSDLRRDLQNAVAFSQAERAETVARTLLALGWLGGQPSTWLGTERHGYRWAVPADLWLTRSHIQNGHAVLNQATELALALVFLANNRRVPPPKWSRVLASGLRWWPSGGLAAFRTLDLAGRTRLGLHRRLKALDRLVTGCVARLDRDEVLMADMTGIVRTLAQYGGTPDGR